MRKLTLTLLVAMMFVFAGTAFAYNLGNVNHANNILSTNKIDNKAPYTGAPYVNPDVVLQGGDTFATATDIASLPYSNVGTTTGYVNDYDAVCPYTGSTAPDVVYKYTPTANVTVDITLCTNSAFDTKLYVHANSYVYGAQIACSDDACSSPSYASFVSVVYGVALTVGNTYYITVDGYGASAGAYTIDISAAVPCDPICPPGGTVEGEPVCADNYVDHYNGGCNSTPNVFQPIACNEIMCGTSGTFLMNGSSYRDTDWFTLTLGTAQTLTWTAVANMPTLIFIIDDGSGTCTDYSILGSATGMNCDTVSLSASVPAGTYYLWIGPSIFGTGAPCPANYVAWATCTAPPEPCVVNCPLGGIPEGEPDCYVGYVDHYNGGCNSTPFVFQPIASGDTICGTSGVFGNYRDTDWYTIDVTTNCDLSWSGKAEFGLLLFIIGAGSGHCTDYSILTYGIADPCSTLTLTYAATPGTYYLWIGPSAWDANWACPSDYVAWVDGCGAPVPCCDVFMVPDNSPVVVPHGGTFGLTGNVGNPGAAPFLTDVWVGVVYNNVFYQLWLFNNIPLNPGQYIQAHLNQAVPNYAPPGTYIYKSYCGDKPTNNKCDSDQFNFTVTGARVDGGSNDWTLEGGFNGVDMPTEYALVGSYPNPFNATTTITYAMPTAGNATLEVYNLMGQKVATLVNGYNEAGQHSVTWDAANYSSGIYFSRLTAGDQVFTQRMTLLK